jgi:hypothetical protein
VITAGSIVVSVLAALGLTPRPTSAVGTATTALLLGTIPFVIGRRLLSHGRVTGATIAGALCIYLVVGLFFATLYGLISRLDAQPFFAGQRSANVVDYLYFSYVTLATVGYGDFTARGDLGRMLSVTEALTGQLYLVTVVAVVVSKFQGRRGSRD